MTRLLGAIALALLLSACAHRTPDAGSPPSSIDSSKPSAAQAQMGPSGATLTVTTATGSATYTVGNLRPVPAEAQIIPAKGSMYSVDVRISAQSGTTIVNGFYFVARAADGSAIAPAVGAVRPGITSGELTQGQSVEGVVAYDVPPGGSISAITLRGPRGESLAAWSVG